jgi:hypothetical protein
MRLYVVLSICLVVSLLFRLPWHPENLGILSKR